MDCSKCIFAVTEKGIQTSCKASRIEKFVAKGKAYRADNETHYSLNQFCNMYRDKEVGDDSLANAKKQIDASFGIVVADDPTLDISELHKTISSLKTATKNYFTNKVALIFSLGINRNAQEVVNLVHSNQAEDIRCEAVIHRYLFDPRIRETEAFQKISTVGWMGMVKSGNEIHEDTFCKINHVINEDLEQIVCFDTKGSLILLTNLVRSQYMNYKGFEDMANSVKEFCAEKNVLGVI